MKTSLAPGSKVVTDYFDAGRRAGVSRRSSASTSSATAARRASATPVRCRSRSRRRSRQDKLVVAAVLSGNRNFEGRVNPLTRFNYLASPPLVVAYALAGRMDIDLTREPLGIGTDGPVFLRDIWPTPKEVAGRDAAQREERSSSRSSTPTSSRATTHWQALDVPTGETLRVGRRLDLREESAVLRGHDDGAAGHPADHRRARARDARRFDHDRPHLAGGQHSGGESRREVADRARRARRRTSTRTARGAATTK